MLKLARLTDYAVAVMAELTRDKTPVPRSAALLSARTGLPEPTVAKVLKKLAQKNLLLSQRGAGGGYVLSRPATHFSIAEIIEAIEGPMAIAACVDGRHGACAVEATCRMRGNWNPVNAAIHDTLAAMTLAEVAGQKINREAVQR